MYLLNTRANHLVILIDRIPFQTLQDEERKQPTSLYVRMKWDANQYFADQPQTIQLCKAIEEGSVEKVDQAIADGADVNAIGLDHMTPLMWAFPSSFEVFEHLLRKGANPNVAYSGRYNFHSFLDTPPFTRNFAVVDEAQYAVTPFSFFRIEKGMSSLNVAEE